MDAYETHLRAIAEKNGWTVEEETIPEGWGTHRRGERMKGLRFRSPDEIDPRAAGSVWHRLDGDAAKSFNLKQ